MTPDRAKAREDDLRQRARRNWVARRMRSGMSLMATVACFLVGVAVLSVSFLWVQTDDRPSAKAPTPNQKNGMQKVANDSPPSPLFKVTIHQPSGPPRVDIGLTSMHGEKLSVACSTCHTTREPNILNRSTHDLDEFHKGMRFSHGTFTCLACHNPKDYDTLHLADSTPLDFQDVMSLCSQCHGTQRRDYDHGSHGGMTGYWDLSRGPRVRNNCVDCHNPHQPKFPKMNPTFKSRDRFLENQSREQHE